MGLNVSKKILLCLAVGLLSILVVGVWSAKGFSDFSERFLFISEQVIPFSESTGDLTGQVSSVSVVIERIVTMDSMETVEDVSLELQSRTAIINERLTLFREKAASFPQVLEQFESIDAEIKNIIDYSEKVLSLKKSNIELKNELPQKATRVNALLSDIERSIIFLVNEDFDNGMTVRKLYESLEIISKIKGQLFDLIVNTTETSIEDINNAREENISILEGAVEYANEEDIFDLDEWDDYQVFISQLVDAYTQDEGLFKVYDRFIRNRSQLDEWLVAMDRSVSGLSDDLDKLNEDKHRILETQKAAVTTLIGHPDPHLEGAKNEEALAV